MPVIVEDHTQVPERILTLLTSHLPSSLPLLRRLQFAARLEGGSTPAARILLAYHTPDSGSNADNRTGPGSEALPSHFAAAYLDPSRSPETECWLYSTLEDGADGLLGTDGIFPAAAEPENGQCLDQLLALLGRIRVVEREYTTSRSDVGAGGATAAGSGAAAPPAVVEAVASSAAGFGSGATITTTATTLFEEKNPPRPSGSVLVGSLHECVRQALLNAGVVFRRTGATPEGLVGWDYYEKWLFRVEDLAMVGNGADLDGNLPEGMRWDVVRDRGDAALVRSRTVIPRNEATLLLLPSMAIRLDDGTPIAWAFLGLDGSLTSLHCEEQYRGRGLAKTLAARLMQDRLGLFGDDGWCSADVSIRNAQSQGVCRSLGGKRSWTVSWCWLDLASVGTPL